MIRLLWPLRSDQIGLQVLWGNWGRQFWRWRLERLPVLTPIYRVNLWRVRVGPFEIRRFERLQPPGEIGKPKAPLTTTEVPAWAWHCLSLAAMVLLALEVACP